MADDDVVFSFRAHLTAPPTQVAVPLVDANEILDWAVLPTERSKELDRYLERARNFVSHRNVVVSEPMHSELLRILADEIERGHPLSSAQAELLKLRDRRRSSATDDGTQSGDYRTGCRTAAADG